MQCPTFGTILTPEMCVKRQAIAKREFLTKKYKNGEVERNFQVKLPFSFKKCCNCSTGKLVRLFPNRFINRDVFCLVKNHLKILNERGYVFKTEVDLICTIVAAKNDKITDEERIELIDHIAEISQKLVIERRINGKPNRILSATGCRIARYLRKQRNQERNQSANTTSIGA